MDSDAALAEDGFPLPLPFKDILNGSCVNIDSRVPRAKLPHEVLMERELMKDADFWWPFLEPLWNPRNTFTWIITTIITSEQESVFTAPTILAAFYLGAASLKNQKIPTFGSTKPESYKVRGGGTWATIDVTKFVGDTSDGTSNNPEDKLFGRAQLWHQLLFRQACFQHQEAMDAGHLITEGSNLKNVAQTEIDQEKLCRICYLNHTTHRPNWEPRRPGMVDKKKVRKAQRKLELLIDLAFEGAEQGPQEDDVKLSIDFLTELLTVKANLKDYRKKTAEFSSILPNLEASCQNAFDRSSRHMSLQDITSITGLRKISVNRGILAKYLRDRAVEDMQSN